jgi:hypothetical protein
MLLIIDRLPDLPEQCKTSHMKITAPVSVNHNNGIGALLELDQN